MEDKTPKEEEFNNPDTQAPEEASVKAKKGMLMMKVLRGGQSESERTKNREKVRGMLVEEMEKKQKAREEYNRNVRQLMQESSELKREKKGFFERQYRRIKQGDKEEVPSMREDEIHKEHISGSVSGAADYMHGISEEKSRGMQDTADTVQGSVSEETPVSGGLQGIRGIKREETFTPEQRATMQRQQEEIVEKEGLRKRWEKLERDKEALREQGMRIREAPTQGPGRAGISGLQKKNMVAITLIIIILISLIAIIISVATRPDGNPQIEENTSSQPVANILDSEQRVLVDVSTSPEDWENISKNRGSQNIVTQYIPYKIVGERSEQINLREFSDFFGMNLPAGLLETVHDYYFAGNYITNTNPNGLFVLSVRKYNDALVWMLNWERQAINAFYSVFPNTVRRSQPGNTTVENRVIDNKDVRILKNPESEYRLIYYFFNSSTLVFIVGNENVVPYINARIRAANAK